MKMNSLILASVLAFSGALFAQEPMGESKGEAKSADKVETTQTVEKQDAAGNKMKEKKTTVHKAKHSKKHNEEKKAE